MAKLDLEKTISLIRKLVSLYVVDKETRAEIAGKSDEEIFAIAEEAINNAERKNDEFIARLEGEEEQ